MKRLCTCGHFDVTHADSAEHQAGWLVVHGLHYCFTVPSIWRSATTPERGEGVA